MKMKKLLAAVLAAACFLGTTGCAVQNAAQTIAANDLTKNVKKAEQTMCLDEDARNHTIEAETTFGVKLLQNEMEKANPLISPLSIASALSMTANGAVGETKAQMEEVLGANADTFSSVFAARQASEKDDKQLKLANSIWFKDTPTLHVEDVFLQKNADCFGAGIYSAPFDDSTKTAINDWVKGNTDGMIPEILDEIPDDAVMYLVNALAFDAKWEDIFETTQVHTGRFTSREGVEQTGDFLYGETGKFLTCEHAEGFLKYYEGQKYAFAALLPEEGMEISEFVSGLTGEELHAILTSPQSESVEFGLPKFKTEFSSELSENLKSLGMTDAFDGEKADFSALGSSDEGNILISRVLHKTFIQVDEAGTKAGAATAVDMVTESAAVYPHSVYLERPFVYMIVDMETKLPVFLGVLTELPEV